MCIRDRRNAFLKGDIDLIYCTTDVLAVEMGEGSAMNSAKYVMMYENDLPDTFK